MRSLGLQFHPEPNVSDALELSGEESRELGSAARAVAAALSRTSEWQAFADARGALTAEAESDLATVRAELRGRLAPEAVDAHEPRLALPRDEYRQLVLQDAIEGLGGPARDYVDAFDALERLVELASGEVLPQLVAYGEPSHHGEVSDLVVDGDQSTVRFVSFEDRFIHVGELLLVDDSLLPDVLHVVGVGMHMRPATGIRFNVNAQPLLGSAGVWRSDAGISDGRANGSKA